MPYLYTAMWFLIGIILIVSMGKEHKIFYFAGSYFILLGFWWLLSLLLPGVDMFKGALGARLRVGSGAVFLVLLAAFAKNYRRTLQQNKKLREAQAALEEVTEAEETGSTQPDDGGEEE